jgi:hypothetical protein
LILLNCNLHFPSHCAHTTRWRGQFNSYIGVYQAYGLLHGKLAFSRSGAFKRASQSARIFQWNTDLLAMNAIISRQNVIFTEYVPASYNLRRHILIALLKASITLRWLISTFCILQRKGTCPIKVNLLPTKRKPPN